MPIRDTRSPIFKRVEGILKSSKQNNWRLGGESANKRSKHKPLAVLFLASYFTRFSGIGGPYGERYVGLYNTFSELFQSKYDCYWYDESGVRLYRFTDGRYKVSTARFLPRILLQLTRRTIKQHGRLLVIALYPQACYKPSFLISSILLFALKISGFVTMILDIIDVPAYAGRETSKLTLFLFHEIICVGMATHVIVNSNSWRNYFSQKYSKNRELKPWLISMGSFHHLVTPSHRDSNDSFNLLYSGVMAPGRGIERLVKCVENVRKRQSNVRLLFITAGTPKVALPQREWLHVVVTRGNYLGAINALSEGDACVIPYSPGPYLNYCFLAKMTTYMVAGKPIISTNLYQTKKILQKWNCGLVARDWTEMEELVVKLCRDRELMLQLGKNARIAAEKEYNWKKLARKLEWLIGKYVLQRSK